MVVDWINWKGTFGRFGIDEANENDTGYYNLQPISYSGKNPFFYSWGEIYAQGHINPALLLYPIPVYQIYMCNVKY